MPERLQLKLAGALSRSSSAVLPIQANCLVSCKRLPIYVAVELRSWECQTGICRVCRYYLFSLNHPERTVFDEVDALCNTGCIGAFNRSCGSNCQYVKGCSFLHTYHQECWTCLQCDHSKVVSWRKLSYASLLIPAANHRWLWVGSCHRVELQHDRYSTNQKLWSFAYFIAFLWWNFLYCYQTQRFMVFIKFMFLCLAGFVGAMISNVAFVFRNIFSKKGMSSGSKVGGMNYYACLSMMSLVFLTPFAFAVEGPKMWLTGWDAANLAIGQQFIWYCEALWTLLNLWMSLIVSLKCRWSEIQS